MESTVIPKLASAATYGGSGGAVFFGLTANEIGVFGGLVIALAGFIVNTYFKWKQDQREQAKS